MVTVKWLSPCASWPAWPAWRWLSSTISSRVGLSAAFSLVRMRVAYSTMSSDFPAAEGAPLPDRPRHYGGAPPARESPLRPASSACCPARRDAAALVGDRDLDPAVA